MPKSITFIMGLRCMRKTKEGPADSTGTNPQQARELYVHHYCNAIAGKLQDKNFRKERRIA